MCAPGWQSDLFEQFGDLRHVLGTSGAGLGGANKVVRGPKCDRENNNAAQHAENTSRTSHVVGHGSQS
jgi:hypothetical protein